MEATLQVIREQLKEMKTGTCAIGTRKEALKSDMCGSKV
jgi:hypothetical protein